MKKNNKGYRIDFAKKNIIITSAFKELAQNIDSDEYDILTRLMTDFPDFRISMPAVKPRKNHGKISYDKMVKYISCQPDSIVLLKRFSEVRELSKGTPSPYNFVKNWFEKTFPAYEELPEFDEKGNLIPQYDITAADRILEEVTANAA